MENVNVQKPSCGIATAGLVLGIITAAFGILGIIPVLGAILVIIGWITGTLAIIFGIIAMCKKCFAKGAWAIGLALFGWLFYWIVAAALIASI